MIMVVSASCVLGSFTFGLSGLKPNFGAHVTLPVTLWILASALLGTASAQGNRLVDYIWISSERVCLIKCPATYRSHGPTTAFPVTCGW